MIERIAKAIAAKATELDEQAPDTCGRLQFILNRADLFAQAVLDALSAGDGVQECDRNLAWAIFTCTDSRVAETLVARHRSTAAAAERARIVAGLRANAQRCDCHALEADECACGAWHDYKTKPVTEIADAIEAGEV